MNVENNQILCLGRKPVSSSAPAGANFVLQCRMPRLLNVLFLALVFGTLWGCRGARSSGDNITYVDLQGLSTAYCLQLNSRNAALQKSMLSDDQRDSVHLESPDWMAELALFRNYDLANPILRGRFKVDSVQIGDAWKMSYRSTVQGPGLREARMLKRDSGLGWVELYDTTENVMYRSYKTLYLNMDSGYYRMDIAQHSRLFRSVEQRIEGWVSVE